MLVPSIIKPAILYHTPQISIIFSESLAIISCGGIQINSLKYEIEDCQPGSSWLSYLLAVISHEKRANLNFPFWCKWQILIFCLSPFSNRNKATILTQSKALWKSIKSLKGNVSLFIRPYIMFHVWLTRVIASCQYERLEWQFSNRKPACCFKIM